MKRRGSRYPDTKKISTPLSLQHWPVSRACGVWSSIEADNEEEGEQAPGHEEAYQPSPSRNTDLVPELVEHDQVEANNEEEGRREVPRHKKTYQTPLFPKHWPGSRACVAWPSRGRQWGRKGRRYKTRSSTSPRNTDLVPELVEHDKVEADNEEEGEEVPGHEEAYQPSPSPQNWPGSRACGAWPSRGQQWGEGEAGTRTRRSRSKTWNMEIAQQETLQTFLVRDLYPLKGVTKKKQNVVFHICTGVEIEDFANASRLRKSP